jgi:alkylated DNA repair protein (DNA oxidative demethylase)
VPRARVAAAPPDGLLFEEAFLSSDEERGLLARFDALEFVEIRMKGVVARRTALRYGLGYDYDRRTPTADAEPIPAWLASVRARCAGLAGLAQDELAQCLVQRYPPGAPIGWHRDSPAYELVVGVSLGSAARMRFRRGPAGDREQYELTVPARSAYVLSGSARWKWEHHVPPAKELRYSITFRSLRRKDRS